MLRKDPDKAAEKQAKKQADREERGRQTQLDAWLPSPDGRARTAREHGAGVFQIAIPLEQTERAFGSMGGSTRGAMRQKTHDPTSVIDAIEAEGWRLEHTGYLFRETAQ